MGIAETESSHRHQTNTSVRKTKHEAKIVSAAEFSLETAYGSVKPAPDDRGLNDIIRDAKDEKAE